MQTYAISNLTEQFNSANDVENDNNKKKISLLMNVFTKCELTKIFNQQKKLKILESRKSMKT